MQNGFFCIKPLTTRPNPNYKPSKSHQLAFCKGFKHEALDGFLVLIGNGLMGSILRQGMESAATPSCRIGSQPLWFFRFNG
jgi:hypothetical protein